jgi:hypothetical protein
MVLLSTPRISRAERLQKLLENPATRAAYEKPLEGTIHLPNPKTHPPVRNLTTMINSDTTTGDPTHSNTVAVGAGETSGSGGQPEELEPKSKGKKRKRAETAKEDRVSWWCFGCSRVLIDVLSHLERSTETSRCRRTGAYQKQVGSERTGGRITWVPSGVSAP